MANSSVRSFWLGRPWPAERSIDLALLLLRVGFGLSMLGGHGVGKLSRLMSENPSFADPFGLGPLPTLAFAVFAEGLCSALIVLGLGTRAATIPLIATMATAFFVAHGDDPFSQGEKSLLFLFAFTALLVAGPGRWSLDRLLFGGKGDAERATSS